MCISICVTDHIYFIFPILSQTFLCMTPLHPGTWNKDFSPPPPTSPFIPAHPPVPWRWRVCNGSSRVSCAAPEGRKNSELLHLFWFGRCASAKKRKKISSAHMNRGRFRVPRQSEEEEEEEKTAGWCRWQMGWLLLYFAECSSSLQVALKNDAVSEREGITCGFPYAKAL